MGLLSNEEQDHDHRDQRRPPLQAHLHLHRLQVRLGLPLRPVTGNGDGAARFVAAFPKGRPAVGYPMETIRIYQD